jgi:hypothetical protein
VNVPTDQFKALSDQVAAYREHEELLIRTIAWLAGGRPEVPREASGRPQLRIITGGAS